MEQRLDMKITAGNLLKYAFPSIFSMLFVGIYSMVGSVFVSRLVSTDALSAINIILPLVNVSTALGMMLATGGSAIVAKKMGEGQMDEARQIFSFMFLMSFLLGILLSVLGLIFMEPIIWALGASEEIYQYCHDYALVTLLLFPCGILAMMLLIFTITAGKAGLGSLLAVFGGITTIALDVILIAVIPLGVTGAALATGLGYGAPALVGILYFAFWRKGTLYFVRPKATLKTFLSGCANGASEMVTNLSLSVVTLLFNLTMMNLVGSDGVAAITIILYAQGFFNSAFMGYSTGIAPIISYNYGKQDSENQKRIFKVSNRILAISSLIIFVASEIFAGPLVGIFTESGTAVYEMGLAGMRVFSLCFLVMGYNVFGSSMFTALSNGKISALISLMRTLVLISICILVLPQIFGLTGVWIAVPVAETLGMVVTLICHKKYREQYGY